MLMQIHDYLRQQKIASNQQVARALGIDLTALEPMLDWWIRKGAISYSAAPTDCQKSCNKCSSTTIKYYEFKD